ncbi:hypothetical protein FOA52_000006 [Chlamydomonas sp. UWO 241]|nr:hypothetical protein FOA52_000006 [Chlamydomonas sp. UWO 241]
MAQDAPAYVRECMHCALISGAISAAKAAAVSGSLYFATMRLSPFFKQRFSASARTALTVMPIFYTAWLNIEHSMHGCMEKHQPKYVSVQDDDDYDE